MATRAPRRFDQFNLTDLLVGGGCLAVSVLMFALGHYLRAVDDRLADFD